MTVGIQNGYKMNFSDKCKVLGELWLLYREDAKTNEAWDAFFTYNDVSLPMAWGISDGLVSDVEDSGLEDYIDETWEMFCEYISIDPNGQYANIAAAWDASPNRPLNEVNEDKDDVASNVKVRRTRKKAEPPSE